MDTEAQPIYDAVPSYDNVPDENDQSQKEFQLQVHLKNAKSVTLTLVQRQLINDKYSWSFTVVDNQKVLIGIVTVTEDGKCVLFHPASPQVNIRIFD